ncbi:WXG100 family type VII secretion target [Arenivirga flava]|uniref:WXG100 family type VII secretion target n=1 Tax=Arenivirga flava TaxID=1930060 RepID=A0AA37UAI9_9MICO|nr:WXG100 family type VII secretion target [Arenivirga flava]GMA27243.1 hypothetical protein GCM10025874_04960 [Arenivirga flava]
MVQFRVRAQSLGEVAGHLQTAIAVFDGHVAQVDGVVGGVVQTSWRGEDADKFAEYWQQWHAQADAVRLSLSTLATLLAAAEGTYTTTESSLTAASTRERQEDRVVIETVGEVAESVELGLESAAAMEAPQLVNASLSGVSGPSAGGQRLETVSAAVEQETNGVSEDV